MGFSCEQCGKVAVARNLCRRHYQRWWKATPKEDRAPALNLKFKSIEDRFWEKVDRGHPDDCWPWNASTSHGGHGEFHVSPERGRVPAHTYAVELTTGTPCPPDREGCHHCDNPPCCNPAHVYYGTRKQNVHDMYVRGRALRGEDRPNSRFTQMDIIAMREAHALGVSEPELARKYDVSTGYVSRILNGKVWSHVGGPLRGQQ